MQQYIAIGKNAINIESKSFHLTELFFEVAHGMPGN
jgi:hypothetical protein